MKSLLGILCILASTNLLANSLVCRQYVSKQDETSSNPHPSNGPQLVIGTNVASSSPLAAPATAIINFVNSNITVQLNTSDSSFQTMNALTFIPDAWLSASYYEAYSNLENENLLYALYFSKGWKNSEDKVIPVMINIDDMKAKQSYRMVLICINNP